MKFQLQIRQSVLALSLMSAAATADVLNIPADYPSFQEAINAASDGDTILVQPGTYLESSINPIGKVITIEGVLAPDGSWAVTIDAEQADSAIICQNGEGNQTIFRNLSVTNGSSNTGGGLLISNASSPRFDNCQIIGNSAVRGGGVYCINDSSPRFESCEFDSNQSDIDGGGFYNLLGCDPVLIDCLFINNQVFSGQFAFGGGMYNRDDSNPVLTNCIFRNNQATGAFSSGGAIANTESSPVLNNCILENNTTGGAGGGMSNTGGGCQPSLTDCLITGNSCTNGGGLSFYTDATAQIINCEISNNSASNGGGILNFSGIDPAISGTVLCGNSPDQINGTWLDNGGNDIADSCASCIGDATGDGVVDVNDVLYLVSAWATTDANADFDGDGLVDTDDILLLLKYFGQSCI